MHKITIDNQDYYVDDDQQNLLIALQNQRAPVKYGCLIGVCGVCALTITDNNKNVEYLPNYDPLYPTDGNTIYPCCCKSTGNLKLTKD